MTVIQFRVRIREVLQPLGMNLDDILRTGAGRIFWATISPLKPRFGVVLSGKSPGFSRVNF
jgi:hypothetical protein